MEAGTKTLDLVACRTQALGSLELIRARLVEDQAGLDWADQALRLVADLTKRVEAARKDETAPINAAKRKVDAKYKDVREALASCDQTLRAKINACLATQRAAQVKALAAVQDAGGAVGKDTLVLAHGTENLVVPEGVSETSWLEWEVVDESAVPPEYKRTCTELVDAELERSGGRSRIPGIRVERKFGVKRKGIVQR